MFSILATTRSNVPGLEPMAIWWVWSVAALTDTWIWLMRNDFNNSQRWPDSNQPLVMISKCATGFRCFLISVAISSNWRMGQRLAETLQANANGIAKRVSKMFYLMHGERLRTGHER